MRWDDYTSNLTDSEAALMNSVRRLTNRFAGSDETVTNGGVRFKRRRTYAAASIKAHQLEVAIDLLREVDHRLLRDRFATTSTVVTHRLTLTQLDQLDDDTAALITEAYDTVGPGAGKR